MYSLKLLSGRDWISGFAQPWILFPKNKVYNELDLVTRLRFKIIFGYKKLSFNSHTLIVEHDGIKKRLQEFFKNKKIVVAKNCLNQIFLILIDGDQLKYQKLIKLKLV